MERIEFLVKCLAISFKTARVKTTKRLLTECEIKDLLYFYQLHAERWPINLKLDFLEVCFEHPFIEYDQYAELLLLAEEDKNEKITKFVETLYNREVIN